MTLRNLLPANIVATCLWLISPRGRTVAGSKAAKLRRTPTLMLCAIGMLSAAGPAQAQTYDPNYPVCMQVYGPISYYNCSFTSIQQCTPLAQGRSAECIVNPYYAGPQHKTLPRQHRYRHKAE